MTRGRVAQHRSPDFLIIGAMKAGTTTLYSDLGGHLSVFLPSIKEPADLVRPEIDSDDGVARYRQLFANAGPMQICGEASTHYTQLPVHCGAAHAAVRVCGPELRIIYLLRDPVERALSHHRHLLSRGLCGADLSIALEEHPEIVQYSRYDVQLAPWRTEFPPSQIALVDFERYVSDREATITAILSFLGAQPDPNWRPGSVRNASEERRRPSRLARSISESRGLAGRLVRRAPHPAKQAVRHVLSQKTDVKAAYVSDRTLNELREQLAMVPSWMKAALAEMPLPVCRERQA